VGLGVRNIATAQIYYLSRAFSAFLSAFFFFFSSTVSLGALLVFGFS
jgi:hypothetical protein